MDMLIVFRKIARNKKIRFIVGNLNLKKKDNHENNIFYS